MATSTKTEICGEEPKCSICDSTLFKVERVSPDEIKLTCENCGEQHLLVITSETKNQSILAFVDAEEHKIENL